MCGIVGLCEPGRGAQVDRELLARATQRLSHRGPDGEGFLLRDNVGLGHRRLSIIDLAGGSQPIFNEDGTVAIVFNGEIYNYKELQPELEGLGHHFASNSDTEAIVHAYEEWGVACLQRFVGMFAFAIWDGRDHSVFVARDRLGKKPLFYHAAGGRLVFASELKALLEHPGVPRELDLRALDDYLAYSYVPSDRCIFSGVQKLPRGTGCAGGTAPSRSSATGRSTSGRARPCARRSGPSAWRTPCAARCACGCAPTCPWASS